MQSTYPTKAFRYKLRRKENVLFEKAKAVSRGVAELAEKSKSNHAKYVTKIIYLKAKTVSRGDAELAEKSKSVSSSIESFEDRLRGAEQAERYSYYLF